MVTLCILDGFGVTNKELGNAVYEAGSSGGGRLAAAKTLSNYGTRFLLFIFNWKGPDF